MKDVDHAASTAMIIAGIMMIILGLFGNILNIYVFFIWSRPRTNTSDHHHGSQTSNSPLYLLVSSISDLILVLYLLLTRIIFDGFNYFISPSNTLILCKLRYFALYIFDFISLTCFCLAILDRFLITSRNVHLRQMSTKRKTTKMILFSIILLLALHASPLAIYFQVSNTGQCVISGTAYSYYYLYVIEVLFHGIIPIMFLLLFGSLTFRNLHILQHQSHGHINHDKQLSRMLILMSLAIVVSSILYCIEQIYYSISPGSSPEQLKLTFVFHIIVSLLFYTNPVLSFYIYFISTPNFRHQVYKFLHYNRHVHPIVHNQVHILPSDAKIH